MVNHIAGYVITVFFIALLIRLSRIPPKLLFRGLRAVLFILLFAVTLNIFLTPGQHVLVHFYFIRITQEGLFLAGRMASRLILLIVGSSMMTLTTSPIQLTSAIESLLKPFKKIKVPAHEIAMMMSIALRFIPALAEEMEKIMKAQKARGADFETGSIINRAKNLIPVLVPLFISAFRRADELATAMDARCYRGDINRTRMKVMRITPLDILAAGCMTVFVLLLLMTRFIEGGIIIKAIILAAGQSKRMRSQTPKVLQPILGKPMLKYITDACLGAGVNEITLVVSPSNHEPIKNALPGEFNFVIQHEAKGTGHAVMMAKEYIKPDDDVLVLYGDMPLITSDFISELQLFYKESHTEGIVTALHMTKPSDFGRVFVSANDMLARIVESKDLTLNDPHTDLINVGVYVFKGEALLYGLARIDNKNKQNEYYLTDVPGALRADRHSVKIFRSHDKTLFAGINNHMQLAEAATIMRGRINARHMENGVRMLDPATTYIDDTVKIDSETVIYPGVILEGNCRIGKKAVIGPDTRMTNTVIGDSGTVQYSVIYDTQIGNNTDIGPFAYLRPGSVIGDNCRIGDFVEIKNAVIGNETNVSHLAYIGDSDLGKNINFSCGAITSNYDGKEKHRTIIKDGAFIGCNTNLVAPVTVEEGAYIAAGSTITENVPPHALAIARERQVNKLDWNR
jgi:bifunctional UDP-N-acetylglucosamine pyrophosphorylase/glucosamine-1-phosphate N-acetyltransferase